MHEMTGFVASAMTYSEKIQFFATKRIAISFA